MGPAWTADAPLSGGAWDASPGLSGSAARLAGLIEALRSAHPELHGDLLAALARRHGGAASELLAGARVQADLGRWFGGDLFERELEWMASREWALTADDVLWRRSKAGLRLSPEQRRAVETWMAARAAG
jgi:glycerol-3-phosphate dehydrogenase